MTDQPHDPTSPGQPWQQPVQPGWGQPPYGQPPQDQPPGYGQPQQPTYGQPQPGQYQHPGQYDQPQQQPYGQPSAYGQQPPGQYGAPTPYGPGGPLPPGGGGNRTGLVLGIVGGVVVLIIIAVVIAAIGISNGDSSSKKTAGGSSGSGSSSSKTHKEPSDFCSIPDLSSLTPLGLTKGKTDGTVGGACQYDLTASGKTDSFSHLDVQGLYPVLSDGSDSVAKQEYSQQKSSTSSEGTLAEVSGVGDEAFVRWQSNSDDTEVSLWARDGNLLVRVSLQVFTDESKATADQLKDVAGKIAASVIAKS